jgi:hypothetical protein
MLSCWQGTDDKPSDEIHHVCWAQAECHDEMIIPGMIRPRSVALFACRCLLEPHRLRIVNGPDEEQAAAEFCLCA